MASTNSKFFGINSIVILPVMVECQNGFAMAEGHRHCGQVGWKLPSDELRTNKLTMLTTRLETMQTTCGHGYYSSRARAFTAAAAMALPPRRPCKVRNGTPRLLAASAAFASAAPTNPTGTPTIREGLGAPSSSSKPQAAAMPPPPLRPPARPWRRR